MPETGPRRSGRWWGRVVRWLGFRESHPEWQRARELIRAVDAGGLPLNPVRVNDIARALGLDVSRRAGVEDTIARIRTALQRHDGA